jgi:hypothetical protein
MSWGDVIDLMEDGADPVQVLRDWERSLPFHQWAMLSTERAYLAEMADLNRIRTAVIADILDRSLSPRWERDTARWPKDDDDLCPTCGHSRY